MSRVDLVAPNLVTLLGAFPSLQPTAGSMSVTPLAADATNFQSVTLTGKEIVLAFNSNSGSTAHTVTITSAADERNRTGDITSYSVAKGDVFAFGPALLPGWKQSDGKLYFQANHAEMLFFVIRLP